MILIKKLNSKQAEKIVKRIEKKLTEPLQFSSWEDRFEKMFRELKAVTPDIIKTFIKDELLAQQQEWKEEGDQEKINQYWIGFFKGIVKYKQQIKEELRRKIEGLNWSIDDWDRKTLKMDEVLAILK